MNKVTIDRALVEQALDSVKDFIEYREMRSPSYLRDALRAALAEPAAEPTCKQPLQVHKQTGWVAHKNQYAVPVLFNPYTGEPRDVRDVQSDPQGVLIVPPGKVDMIAASPPPPAEPAVDRKTSAMHAAVRKVLQYHGLVKGSDGVVEADLIYAVLDAPSPPAKVPLLSDEEMWQLWNAQGDDAMDQVAAIAFARAIEQLVRRKAGL